MADKNPFLYRPQNKSKRKLSPLAITQAIVIGFVTLVLLYLFVITPNQVDGTSMHPTLQDDQWVLTNRLAQLAQSSPFLKNTLGEQYQAGDIIVISKPNLPNTIIKRIIAIPGDEIMIQGQQVYVNSQLLDEEYLPTGVTTRAGDFIESDQPYTVPEDSYVVLGDNRPDSLDSRDEQIGYIMTAEIVGKVIMRILPIDQLATTSQLN